MSEWSELLAGPGPVLADGAMGTMLFELGLQFGDSPEGWNLEHPDKVKQVHRGYLEAGARLVLTNTFGGNRFRLGMHGMESQVAEFNRAGARLARAAVAETGQKALIAGDIGPSGGIMAPLGDLDYEQARRGFAEQARALLEGGVDLFWIETISSLEEMKAAFDGVRTVERERPIITTMTFDTRGRTMMGVTPEEAASALTALGAAAVGGNCGNGPEEILEVIRKMKATAQEGTVLVSKANAGIPRLEKGRAVYEAGPREMGSYALAAREAGAVIIGACCGSTPAHLREMARALALGRAG
ncbi:MAG: homocysteine S-methyltransferase family protein [Anaerolineales bacterium]